MGDSLKGKTAVVVGSGQGIGRAVAILMAKEGARVVTNNRKPGSTGYAMVEDKHKEAVGKDQSQWLDKEMDAMKGDAETTAQQIRDMGGEAASFFGDISDFKVAGQLIEAAMDNFGRIDILANIAGAFGIYPLEELTEEIWDRVTGVKPKGYFNTIRHAAPHMIKQKSGRIINTVSRAFNGDVIKHVEYCAANAGVYGLTKAVAIEMFEHGITCNAISPWAKTRASYELETLADGEKEEDKVWMSGKKMSLLDITPGPEFIAPFVCYLASEAASHISGSIFNLGGNNIGMYSEPVISHNLVKSGAEPWTVQELAQQVPMGLLQGYEAPAKQN
jgi:3-oxoacyl-[acyl-carrier protein] reductase